MNSVCIITNEIYPLDRGGIARLAYNFAVDNLNRGAPAELHFLVPASFRPKARQVETEFDGLARIHFCGESLRALGPLGRVVQQSGPKDSLDFHMVESLRYLCGLLDAQRELGREFDFVEFPDFGGWAAAAIAAKRAGIAFANTTLAVRLHSSFGLIVDHEPFVHEPSDWMAGICDLERQGLVGADVVIAHLYSTARLNLEHFGFGEDWMRKIRLEMPPILLTQTETGDDGDGFDPGAPRDFLFSSRLQGFKRPDLFIRAAVHFLDHDAEGDSMFRVASYGWDRDYIDWLKRLVPARWRGRILFLDNVAPAQRARLMRESILVIPSDFESLCLLAYEARELGTKLILNRRCRAFGSEHELWRERVDCLFFGGDFVSLSDTMRDALSWQPGPYRKFSAAKPYWEDSLPNLHERANARVEPLSLSLVLYGASEVETLGKWIGNLQAVFGLREMHVLAPREAFSAAGTPVAAWQVRGVSIHLTGWPETSPGEIQALLRELASDAVAFLPADMEVEQGFWTTAAEILAANPNVAVVTSHNALEEAESSRRITLNYGYAPTVAQLSDRIAHRASVFRRDVLLEFGLREEAGERWHEDLCLRLVSSGREIVVVPALMASRRGSRRQSRISSSRFFATHRDEAGRRFGIPYRQGSAGVSCIDSIESLDHVSWIARIEERRIDEVAPEQTETVALQFKNVVLKNNATGDDGNYAELEIALEEIQIGRVPIDWIAFKMIRYMGDAQLEFRDGGNAGRFFRDWPPPTSDSWGPLAVWSAGSTPHPNREFFENAGQHDQQRLALLLGSLPEVLRSLALSERERAQWLRVARTLQRPT